MGTAAQVHIIKLKFNRNAANVTRDTHSLTHSLTHSPVTTRNRHAGSAQARRVAAEMSRLLSANERKTHRCGGSRQGTSYLHREHGPGALAALASNIEMVESRNSVEQFTKLVYVPSRFSCRWSGGQECEQQISISVWTVCSDWQSQFGDHIT